MRVTDQETFLIAARNVHGDLYNYEKAVYVKAKEPVCIIDPVYGEFWQTPSHHIRGQGNPYRSGVGKLTTQTFIERAEKVHNNLYDYSKVVYKNNSTKVCIIDPVYGEFWQEPHSHLKGAGSPQRAIENGKKLKSKTTETFIAEAIERFGNTFDYSNVEYVNSKTPVCIIDPVYGEFWQTPYDHLKSKHGNMERGRIGTSENKTFTNEVFIERSREVHGHLYDYSKVEYTGAWTKVCIIDPVYGEFWQEPIYHWKGHGNPIRGFEKTAQSKRLTLDEFIEKANLVHDNLYDYSKVVYVNNSTKVCIIDPVYGEFWQTPSSHLMGCGNNDRANISTGLKNKMSIVEFINRANEIHDEQYDYSKVEYIDARTKVCIIDPESGDEFWQTPSIHLRGCGNPRKAHRNQKIAYISGICNAGEYIGLKYGIETILGRREYEQNLKCYYDIKRISSFKFENPDDCIAAETECKKLFQTENIKIHNTKGIIERELMEDGWSETTSIHNLEMIKEIYFKYGATEIV